MSESDGPVVVVVAGPNGAGKSTAAPSLIRDLLGITEFVNADVIAQGLSAFAPDRAAIEAGRIMLQRLRDLAARGESFAFETTLASRSFAPWLRQMRVDRGYRVMAVYIWLISPELALARVRDRVVHGGHDVPEDTVRRRYARSLRNFFTLYEPVADAWQFWDNSCQWGQNEPVLIASKSFTGTLMIHEIDLWRDAQEQVRA